MKVLYLHHSAQISGAERSLCALLRQLRDAFPDIETLTGVPEGGNFASFLRAENFPVETVAVPVIHRPRNVLHSMTQLVALLRLTPSLLQLMRRSHCDIVHCNSTTAHLAAALAAERANIPVVWHVRDLVSLGRLGPSLSDRADAVVAISGCVAERLQRDGVARAKIRIVPNGLDLNHWSTQRAPRHESKMRRVLKVRDDEVLFGCVGQVVEWKNQLAFIEAAAQMLRETRAENVRFVLVGSDLWGENRDYQEQLERAIARHKLQNHLAFLPFQQDGRDVMAALDVLVLPSHREPFGRVLIEAMALQKAVVAFAEYGGGEIVGHNHDGLLVPALEEGAERSRVLSHDTQALCAAMTTLWHDAALRRQLGENARTIVENRFDIALTALRIHEIYREMAA